jgi:hypothetical protein
MTKDEVIEGNKLIAEFMGLEYLGKNVFGMGGYVFNLQDTSYEKNCLCYSNTEGMEYHSSWGWLMHIIDKIDFTEINGRNANVEITWWETKIKHPLQCFDSGHDAKNDSRIFRTWSVVVEFIKWYNNQKK